MDAGKYDSLGVDGIMNKMDQVYDVFEDFGPPMDEYDSLKQFNERGDHNTDQLDPDLYSYINEMDEEELMRRYYEKMYEENPDQFLEEDDYLPEEYDEYYDDQYNGYYDNEYSRITLSELSDRCIFPTLSQAIDTVYPLLGLCIVTRLTFWFSSEALQSSKQLGRLLNHSVSAVCGVVALYTFFEENTVYLVMLALLGYTLLYMTHLKCQLWCGLSVAFITLVYLLTCELLVVQETQWHRIRGAQMVLSMKIISLAFDLDSRGVAEVPNMLEYLGYVFQVGTVVFGPWISFNEYCATLSYRDRKMDFYWFWKCARCLMMSFLYIIISTCIIHWLILDEEAFIWLLAYRDAQSFRFSHYFISSLSEASATMTGVGATKNNGDVRWDLTVSKPYSVEFPRSLVEVVSNWNLPMHFWLKTYVFKTARPLGTFAAISLTYIASSVLHGLNFQLAAVLLSLGVYSYVEYVLRQKLSRVFDACIQAKRCKNDCDHLYKSKHPYVILVNVGFGLLTVFHLAYLGLMFDNSPTEEEGYNMDHTLAKWSILGYTSHWLVLFTYIFYQLI